MLGLVYLWYLTCDVLDLFLWRTFCHIGRRQTFYRGTLSWSLTQRELSGGSSAPPVNTNTITIISSSWKYKYRYSYQSSAPPAQMWIITQQNCRKIPDSKASFYRFCSQAGPLLQSASPNKRNTYDSGKRCFMFLWHSLVAEYLIFYEANGEKQAVTQ